MDKGLTKKIKLQSVLLVAILLSIGVTLLVMDSSLDSVTGMLGVFVVLVGLALAVVSFWRNQEREESSSLVERYDQAVKTLNDVIRDRRLQEKRFSRSTSTVKTKDK